MPAIQRDANGHTIRIHLFGRMEVQHASRPEAIHVPGKAQELLAYLVLHPNREFRREHLAEVLWGGRRLEQSRKYLRHALWVLRDGVGRLLPGRSLLRSQGQWVRGSIDEAIWIDVHEFERSVKGGASHRELPLPEQLLRRYVRGVDLHRGDLLEGWEADWCVAPRERLRGQCVAMLDGLMAHFEDIGDPARAAHAATRTLELDPARETAHRVLMRAMAASRDRTGALRQYSRCEAVLKREFGAMPEAETRALYEAIRKGEGA